MSGRSSRTRLARVPTVDASKIVASWRRTLSSLWIRDISRMATSE